ncbi:MAG: response regulator [Candidatus Omnitrophica bacterium]|nr:response regulator [Candidatus Omnitrophota bacterium]
MAQKILIIDDERVNLSLVKFTLAEKGYAVSQAVDGEEGIAKVQSESPDLIILDVQMPRMNGYEFMGALKSLQGAQITPVIMLTANETMEGMFKLEGARAYFVKPVNMAAFLSKVKEILSAEKSGQTSANLG